MPKNECSHIEITESEASRRGVEYKVANGNTTLNLGERLCLAMTGATWPKRLKFQTADIHKPLISVTKLADAGFDCYLGKDGGSLHDRVT